MPVNPRLAAAIAASNAASIRLAAESSMAMTYVTAADTIGLVMHNAVVTQHGMQTVARAATVVTSAHIIAAAVSKMGSAGG